jgi:nucleoside-diphosphate-sugar epimerase
MSALGRVVVTGAAGFIGTHLVKYLRGTGAPVLAVVRRSPPESMRLAGVEYLERDLERVGTLGDVLRREDNIVHLAGRAHVMRDDVAVAGAAYQRANVDVTRMLCRSASESGARRLVYVSTAKVFGEGRERPFTPADPLVPSDLYSQSKVDAEQAVREAGRSSALEWTIIRPPFVYGPGGKGNFPRLVALARLSTIVPLPFGSVANQRSIVYVENLVDAIVRCGLHPRAQGEILLPTDARDVSTAELLRAIARARGSRARLLPCPRALLRAAARLAGRSDEMTRLTETLRLDSSFLHDRFDWQPPFSLERAIARSIGTEPLTASKHD